MVFVVYKKIYFNTGSILLLLLCTVLYCKCSSVSCIFQLTITIRKTGALNTKTNNNEKSLYGQETESAKKLNSSFGQ